MAMELLPRHEPEQRRFTLDTQPLSVLDYRLEPGLVVFVHTGVPDSYQGQGLAGRLVEAALKWARAQGLKVVPECSYVQSYIERHPEWQGLLA